MQSDQCDSPPGVLGMLVREFLQLIAPIEEGPDFMI